MSAAHRRCDRGNNKPGLAATKPSSAIAPRIPADTATAIAIAASP
jgi:hypothetical protein